MVYVLDIRGNPMMPTKNARARRFLKQKKAKVKTIDPFTIQLTYEPETHILQECTMGIDTGSGTIGSAVIDSNSNVLYRSNIQIRNDIKQKMDRRRAYRRTRRNRKTRYRNARFLNRKKSMRKGRFSATITSKIEAHKKEIEFIKKILPITMGRTSCHCKGSSILSKKAHPFRGGMNCDQ